MSEDKKQNIADDYDYIGQAASATEQTGLMPTAAQSESEKESYRMLYPYPPPLLKTDGEK
ncbi:MAG: hypothetical protein LUD14_01885 [Clostridiales bacterium]|nr:hypothetical protein [Clostridiales bacterium]